jgi:hypothetical protein
MNTDDYVIWFTEVWFTEVKTLGSHNAAPSGAPHWRFNRRPPNDYVIKATVNRNCGDGTIIEKVSLFKPLLL